MHILRLAILLLISMPLIAAADEYQRYIKFQNDFPFPVFPVIQVPANNCDVNDTGVWRILVNQLGDNGIGPGKTVTVNMPNITKKVTDPNTGKEVIRGCWYNAGRIYIFPVNVLQYEKNLIKLDPNSAAMTTVFDDPKHPSERINCDGNCYTGVAKASFAIDNPAQLAEYTFDSDNSDAFNDPNKGIPMADIDISNVDELYLPVAASVDNNGATGYMGSAEPLDSFIDKVRNFIGFQERDEELNWPYYAAYAEVNWKNNAFYSLLPPQLGQSGMNILPHTPSGYNIINNTLGHPYSALYSVDPKIDPKVNQKFLITHESYDDATRLPSNPVTQIYIDRWMKWINGNPCNDLDSLKWPDNIADKFDKANFCNKFATNIQYLWNHFLNDPKDGFNYHQADFYIDCGLLNKNDPPEKMPTDVNLRNSCIIQHIVGYNSEVVAGELPGRVQAALRSVAYDPIDGNQQYQFDPFLLFAAPYNSEFNLNPYTRFIHNAKDGIGAVAYSFSIDDKYGNFRDKASGFTINAGGVSALKNKTPYDPYQQYRVSWGYVNGGENNWNKADICGTQININAPGNHSLAINKDNPCAIIFYDNNGHTLQFNMAIKEKQVMDTYTGAMVSVYGFREGALPPPPPVNPPKAITSFLSSQDLSYCESNSSPELRSMCQQTTISATMSDDPLARDVVYMGLDFKDMPRLNLNLPPAPQ